MEVLNKLIKLTKNKKKEEKNHFNRKELKGGAKSAKSLYTN